MLESQWLPDEVVAWLWAANRWVVSSEALFAVMSPPPDNCQVPSSTDGPLAKGHLYNHTENKPRKPPVTYTVNLLECLKYWNLNS